VSLVLSLGSNLGNKLDNLNKAISSLNEIFLSPISISRVYQSEPFGPVPQDDFYNLCIEYKLPNYSPEECMQYCLNTELIMGRTRDIKWGPRVIDIDILYYGLNEINSEIVTLPHPHIMDRSFVVLPLGDLSYFDTLQNHFEYPTIFSTTTKVIKA